MAPGRPHGGTMNRLVVLVVIVTGMGYDHIRPEFLNEGLDRGDHFLSMLGQIGVLEVVDLDSGCSHEVRTRSSFCHPYSTVSAFAACAHHHGPDFVAGVRQFCEGSPAGQLQIIRVCTNSEHLPRLSGHTVANAERGGHEARADHAYPGEQYQNPKPGMILWISCEAH
ncbi:hypothetical protein D3C73_1090230 [compost metagenome]